MSALLFKIQCIYQPGGSSERSMLLSRLVSPEVVKSLSSGVVMLRKWQQNFVKVRELNSALPDSSLLLRGLDQATSTLLSGNPPLGFRVNAFRNRVSLDYNPTVSTVLQYVRLLQAKFESASLSQDLVQPDKRARTATLVAGAEVPPVPKAPTSKASGQAEGTGAQAKAIGGIGEPKGKG